MYTRFMQITILVVITILVLGMLGCGKAVDPTSDFKFPLAVDNNWKYDYSQTASNIRGDSAAIASRLKVGMHGQAHIIVRDYIDPGIDSIPTFEMQSVFIVNDVVNTDIGYTYLNNTSAGLIIYESNNRFGFTLHKPTQPEYYLEFESKRYSSIHELINSQELDGSVLDAPTFKPADENDYTTLMYPLAIGRTWIATYATSIGFLKKTIQGFEDITVPAGEFSCYVIDSRWETAIEGELMSSVRRADYFSSEGLIKREILYPDVHFLDETNTLLGIVDLHTNYELTSFVLK